MPVLIALDEMTDHPTTETVLTTDGICRLVADYALRHRPGATACSIVIESEDGDGRTIRDTIAVPLAVAAATGGLTATILTVLSKMGSGEWLSGGALAFEIDEGIDHRTGSFRRAIGELKAAGKIESHPKHGYRLLKSL